MQISFLSIIIARVRILPERELDPPLEGATPNSYRRLIGYERQRTSGLEMTHDHLAILQQWIKTNKGSKKKVCLRVITHLNITVNANSILRGSCDFFVGQTIIQQFLLKTFSIRSLMSCYFC